MTSEYDSDSWCETTQSFGPVINRDSSRSSATGRNSHELVSPSSNTGAGTGLSGSINWPACFSVVRTQRSSFLVLFWPHSCKLLLLSSVTVCHEAHTRHAYISSHWGDSSNKKSTATLPCMCNRVARVRLTLQGWHWHSNLYPR